MSASSFTPEVLTYFLHGFTEVKEAGSVAAVCQEWRQVLRDDAFWKNACVLRWPSTARVPIQNFFRCYRSQVLSLQSHGDSAYDAVKWKEWCADTYLMIEAVRDGKHMSLALHFMNAVEAYDEYICWQVCELGCDDGHDEGSQLGNLFLKTCHLWRASDGRMCLLAKNLSEGFNDGDGIIHVDPQPAVFWAEPDNSMSFQLRYSATGATAHRSEPMRFGFRLMVVYDDTVPRGPYPPLKASFSKPVLIICGYVFQDEFPTAIGHNPPSWPIVHMREVFHMTSVLCWK